MSGKVRLFFRAVAVFVAAYTQIPVAVADLSGSAEQSDPSVRISSEKIKVEITGTVSGDMLSAIIRALKC